VYRSAQIAADRWGVVMRITRTLASITAAVALVAGSLLAASSASAAPPPSAAVTYAALGDSYAAGFGGGAPYDQCGRSMNGYPTRLVGIGHIQLVDDAACSGSTTADVIAQQVPTIPATTRLVTLTVGGDDVGFGNIVFLCFIAQDPQLCQQAVDAGQALITSGELTARIAETIAAVHAQAPGARVVVTGYPLLFALPSKYGAAAVLIDQAIPALNAAIQAGAVAAGATYVDVIGAFAGHGIGASVPWLLDFTPATPNPDAFHPNASGYKAYTNAVKPFVS
jgi:lysophospholipase L1-like esterase